MSNSLRLHGLHSTRNSLGQNTGLVAFPFSNPGVEHGSSAMSHGVTKKKKKEKRKRYKNGNGKNIIIVFRLYAIYLEHPKTLQINDQLFRDLLEITRRNSI